MRALLEASEETLEAIPEVGPTIARSVRSFLDDPASREEVERLNGVLRLPAAAPPPGHALEGMTFVLTGTLSEPRPRVQQRIEAAGGKVTSSVSSRTTCLVAGERAGAKLRQAQKLEVEVIDEEELRKRLEG